jgi:hypothetical protein
VELRHERERLEADLEAAPTQPIALHPSVLADYQDKLERLQEAIERDVRDCEPEHAAAIRDLVECVTVQHDDGQPDKIRIEITGRLNSLLGENAFPNRVGRLGGSGGPLHASSPHCFSMEIRFPFFAA